MKSLPLTADGVRGIYNPSGDMVAMINLAMPHDDAEALRALIVRACNHFEEMHEALKGFMEYYQAYNPMSDERIGPYAKEVKAVLAKLDT